MFVNSIVRAIGGFLLALCPLTNDLLGWRGAGVLGAAETGNYFFFGGLLMIIGGVLEFILGNTFPFVVFCMFGAFWLAYAGKNCLLIALTSADPLHSDVGTIL